LTGASRCQKMSRCYVLAKGNKPLGNQYWNNKTTMTTNGSFPNCRWWRGESHICYDA
jgi:hypothetical protein